MKNKNFMIFMLLVMALFLVPSKVRADHPTSGGITCTYSIKYRDSLNKSQTALYQVNIENGSFKTGNRWIGDTCKNGACLMTFATGINSKYINSSLEVLDAFADSKQNDWICPKISVGVFWDNSISAYQVYIDNANNANKVKESISYQNDDEFGKKFNASITGTKSNYVKPSANAEKVVSSKVCTYKAGVNGQTVDVVLTLFYGEKFNPPYHTVSIEGSSEKEIHGFNYFDYYTKEELKNKSFSLDCPSDLKYCVVGDDNTSDLVVGGEENSCYDYMTDIGRISEFVEQVPLVEGDKTILDGNGDETVISGDSTSTENVNGMDKEDILELILDRKEIDTTCEGILGDTIFIINEILGWIQILAPILLILFGCLDFAKAAIANDDSALKKATSNFGKRALAAVAVFLVPFMIRLILGLDGIHDVLGETLCEGIGKVVIK